MTVAQRIKSARLAAKFSQEKLAQAISHLDANQKVSRTAIAQWESGVTKELTASNLLKAAKILGVSPEWLRFGTSGREMADSISTKLLVDFPTQTIPVLTQQQAANYLDYMNRSNTEFPLTGIDPILATVTSNDTFALKIIDQSMSPEFSIGDLALIDPAIKPQSGDIVLVSVKNTADLKTILLRKYQLLEKGAQDLNNFELIPFNADWPKVVVNNQNPAQMIGTLVEHRCKRRLFTGLVKLRKSSY